jgi:hypothetical protein
LLADLMTDSAPFFIMRVTPPSISLICGYPQGVYDVNGTGEYDYLKMPDCLSQDFENRGRDIHPTPKKSLDAYINPFFLQKTKQHLAQ